MFHNRIEAGQQLARALQRYHSDQQAIVIGLPRGGVPVAYAVAHSLHLPLDIICPRKIGMPGNEEYAIGAVSETGDRILNNAVIIRFGISQEYIDKTAEKEKLVAQHRIALYRRKLKKLSLRNKRVIIVDDGLATGATMKAAIQTVYSDGASEVIVAVPVGPKDTVDEIAATVDKVVCLQIPDDFMAVGQFYINFSATSDDEVVELLALARAS